MGAQSIGSMKSAFLFGRRANIGGRDFIPDRIHGIAEVDGCEK